MSFDERTVVGQVQRVSLKELRIWVREGWVRPAQSDRGPIFDEVDIARVRLLCDLKKDMSLPTDALPVVLALLDNLNQTRRELRALTAALDTQPEIVRRTVVTRFHDIHNGMNEPDGEG